LIYPDFTSIAGWTNRNCGDTLGSRKTNSAIVLPRLRGPSPEITPDLSAF
jgi:hypothetical protein